MSQELIKRKLTVNQVAPISSSDSLMSRHASTSVSCSTDLSVAPRDGGISFASFRSSNSEKEKEIEKDFKMSLICIFQPVLNSKGSALQCSDNTSGLVF